MFKYLSNKVLVRLLAQIEVKQIIFSIICRFGHTVRLASTFDSTTTSHESADPQSSSSNNIHFTTGEHVIIAWFDKNYIRELGIVNQYKSVEKILISHLITTKYLKTSWVFPEDSIDLPAEHNKIILTMLK